MKRSVFFIATLVLVLAMVFQAGAAPNPKEFKLGFMTSLSGAFAPLAETQRKGTLLAVAEINERGGDRKSVV